MLVTKRQRRILQRKTKALKLMKLLKRCHLDLHKKPTINFKILMYQICQTQVNAMVSKNCKLNLISSSREKVRPNFRVTCEKLENLLWKCKMIMSCHQTTMTSRGALKSKKQINWQFQKTFSSLI